MDRSQTARAFGWNMLFAAINRVIVPLGMVLFNRVLGPTTMGVYGLIATILAMADLFRDGGLTQTYIADQEMTTERERAYHTLAVITAAFLASVILIIGLGFGDKINLPVEQRWTVWWIALVLIGNGFLTIPSARLQREARFRDVGMAEMVASLTSFGLAVVLVFSGFGIAGLVWMLIVRAIINLVLIIRLTGSVAIGSSRALIGRVFRRSSTVLGSLAVGAPFGFIDNLLISSRLGPTQLGFYAGAWNIGMKPGELVTAPLVRVLYVAYSKRLGDDRDFANAYVRSVSMVCLLVLPVYAVLGVFSGSIIEALLGKDWSRSAGILSILAPYYAFRSVGSLGCVALTAGGKASSVTYSWIAGYTAVALMICTRWATIDVEWFAASFMTGAIVVYSSSTILALRRYVADPAVRRSCFLNLTLGLFSVLLAWAIHMLHLPVWGELVAASFAIPPIYLFVTGLVHHRRPLVYLSPAGLRRLYSGL
jgi:O-antigen/teichoic acid export membrane protein